MDRVTLNAIWPKFKMATAILDLIKVHYYAADGWILIKFGMPMQMTP